MLATSLAAHANAHSSVCLSTNSTVRKFHLGPLGDLSRDDVLPFAERTLPAAYLPPVERGSLDGAVSRAALRRLSHVLGVRPAAAFRYSSACHMTVVE